MGVDNGIGIEIGTDDLNNNYEDTDYEPEQPNRKKWSELKTDSYKNQILDKIGSDMIEVIIKCGYDPKEVWPDLKHSNTIESILNKNELKNEILDL